MTIEEKLDTKLVFDKRHIFIASLFFLGFFSLYSHLLCPTFNFGDSPELIFCAFTFSIAHPPGYPLWLLLAKPFTFFPLGSISFRVNIFCALLASMVLATLYLFLKILAKFLPKIDGSAIIAVFLLGLSPIFAEFALSSEIYHLNTILIILLTFSLILALFKRSLKWMLVSFFLCGLGTGNHHTIFLILPLEGFIFIYSILKNKAPLLKSLSLAITFFLIGCSVNLYQPLRSITEPKYNWSKPSNFSNFIFHFTRSQYGALNKNPRDFNRFTTQLISYLKILKDQFSWLILISPLAIVALPRFNYQISLIFLYIFLVCSIGFILIINFNLNPYDFYLIRVFYLPSFLIMAIWIGISFSILLSQFFKPFCYYLSVCLAGLIGAFFLNSNFKQLNLQNYWMARDYPKVILNSVPFKSRIVAQDDLELFGLLYLNDVEIFRDDIEVIDFSGSLRETPFKPFYRFKTYAQWKENTNREMEKLLSAENKEKVFFTWRADRRLFSNGILYAFPNSNKPLYPSVAELNEVLRAKPCIKNDLLANICASRIYYRQGEYFEKIGETEKAQKNYSISAEYGRNFYEYYYLEGVKLMENKRFDEAEKLLKVGINLYPNDEGLHIALYHLYSFIGENKKALQVMERIEKIRRDMFPLEGDKR